MIDKVKYNKTFQSKIIASLVTDKQFLQKMYPIIDYTLFDSVELQQVVRWTMNYWENYKDIPNREYFELELNKIDVKTDKALKYGLNELVNNVYDVHIPSNGLEYIKDESFNFFNNQNWKKTILLCVDAVEGEDFDQVQKLIKDAYSVTNQTEIGLDYKTTAIDRYTKLKRVTVTTGFDELDQALKGGFGNGDLITIIAPTGIGKSWLLANFGSNALLAGKNVVHFTLELTETQTAIRYDTILTKTPVNILEKDPSLVDNFINNNPQLGESIISFYTMKSVTVPKLKTHVEQIRVDKFKPDIVFIDYGDLIKPTSNYRDKRLNLEEVYEDLKKMAQELDIPVVTASQTNRSGTQKSIIQNDDIAESFNKVFCSDIILTFSRKLEDKVNDVGNLHLSKNRYGADGRTFDITTNLNIGQISVKSENHSAVQNYIKEMNNNGPTNFQKQIYSKMKSKTENIFR